jgi:hypothetical protein
MLEECGCTRGLHEVRQRGLGVQGMRALNHVEPVKPR